MKYYSLYYRDTEGFWIRYSDKGYEKIYNSKDTAMKELNILKQKLHKLTYCRSKFLFFKSKNLVKDEEKELYKLIMNTLKIREVKIYDY